MAPISAESNVRSGFASLETVRDMARLRCPNEFLRTGRRTRQTMISSTPIRRPRKSAATMRVPRADYQHEAGEGRGAPQYVRLQCSGSDIRIESRRVRLRTSEPKGH